MRLSIQNCRCRPCSPKATHQPLRGFFLLAFFSILLATRVHQAAAFASSSNAAHTSTSTMSAKGTCDSKVLDWCWSAGVAAPGPRTSVCRPRVHLIEITLDEGRGDLQECRHELVLMTPCSSVIDAALSSGVDILRFVAGQSGRQRLCCTLARELGVLDGHPVHIRKMNISHGGRLHGRDGRGHGGRP